MSLRPGAANLGVPPRGSRRRAPSRRVRWMLDATPDEPALLHAWGVGQSPWGSRPLCGARVLRLGEAGVRVTRCVACEEAQGA